jgi:site-specific recombinase XerD
MQPCVVAAGVRVEEIAALDLVRTDASEKCFYLKGNGGGSRFLSINFYQPKPHHNPQEIYYHNSHN